MKNNDIKNNVFASIVNLSAVECYSYDENDHKVTFQDALAIKHDPKHFSIFTPVLKSGDLKETEIDIDYTGIDFQKYAVHYISARYSIIKRAISDEMDAYNKAWNSMNDEDRLENARKKETLDARYGYIMQCLNGMIIENTHATAMIHALADTKAIDERFPSNVTDSFKDVMTALKDYRSERDSHLDDLMCPEMKQAFAKLKTALMTFTDTVWVYDKNSQTCPLTRKTSPWKVNSAFVNDFKDTYLHDISRNSSGKEVRKFKTSNAMMSLAIRACFMYARKKEEAEAK